MDAERRCREEAAETGGTIRGSRAAELGLSPGRMKGLVRSGRWQRLHRGIYVIDGAPSSFRQQAAAAAAIGAACSHRCAAALWNLEGIPARQIEITVPSTSRSQRFNGSVIVHRTNHLPDDHVQEHQGVPVTDVARTILDLGGILGFKTMRRAALSAVDRKLVTPGRLAACLRCCGKSGRPGTANLRSLMATMNWELDMSDSELEDVAFDLIVREGLPAPERLHRAYEGNLLLGEIDLAYPEVMLGIEVDSYEFHGARPDFVRDRGRINGFQAAGWRILHFVYEDALRPRRFLHVLTKALEPELNSVSTLGSQGTLSRQRVGKGFGG